MIKPKDPRELALAMMDRSICSVQVGAVLADNWGIFGWAANHVGFDGLGQHAEAECLRRANRRRLAGSTMYVATRRQRNLKPLNSRPCERCQSLLRGVGRVVYRDKDGRWVEL